MSGSGKWVLLPSFQPGVFKHPKNPQCIPIAELVPEPGCAPREEREKGWEEPPEQDMELRAGWNPQIRV